MDGNRFDHLTRTFASGRSRRSLLKGLLGLGGVAATTLLPDNDVNARRSSSSSPAPPPACPGQVVCPDANHCCNADQCNTAQGRCCPVGTLPCDGGCCEPCGGTQCGLECCDSALQCCDGECCAGGYSCLTQVFPGSAQVDEETCCRDDLVCDTASEKCCAEWERCCPRDGAFYCIPADGCCSADDCAAPADPCLQSICPVGDWVCSSIPNPGVPCDDGDACTTGDSCSADGLCVGTPVRPTITCPGNTSGGSSTGLCGTVTSFEPSSTCATSVTCDPPSGSSVSVGETVVACAASGPGGQADCQFSITVTDTEAPAITCPADITVTGPQAVSWTVTASDNCEPNPPGITCNPASGSQFAIGQTSVTCRALDNAGNFVECTFEVDVACEPACAGKGCGAEDGCGGLCNGECLCEQGATCTAGVCSGGSGPITCLEKNSDPCIEEAGRCNPAVGCVYDPLPDGLTCGNDVSGCRPSFCRSGSCVEEPIECGECQTCVSGTCTTTFSWPSRVVSCEGGNGKVCIGGQCGTPCSESCPPEWCVIVESAGGNESPLCCPESARNLETGQCCWFRDGPGTPIGSSCYDPAKVCSDGSGGFDVCDVDCCGRNGNRNAGTGTCCPAESPYCSNDICVAPDPGECGFDVDCPNGVCAGATRTIQGGPDGFEVIVTRTGTCCPSGYSISTGVGDPGGTVWSCCGSSQQPCANGGCAPFPDYDCPGCTCSFGSIRRCC